MKRCDSRLPRSCSSLLLSGLLLAPLVGCRPPAPPPPPAASPASSAAALDARPSYRVPVTVLTYQVKSGLGRAVEREISRRLQAAGVATLRVEGRGEQLAIVVPRTAAAQARAVVPAQVELALHPVDDRSDYLGGLQPAAPLQRRQGASGEAAHLATTRASEAHLAAALTQLRPPAGTVVAVGYLGSPIASDEREGVRTYLLGPALATGDRLNDVSVQQDKSTRRPVVAAVFEPTTRSALARHGAAARSAQVAVVLDGRILAVLPAAALAGAGPVSLVTGEPDDPPDMLGPLFVRIKQAALPQALRFLHSVDPPAAPPVR